jgi:hypothetical protein
MSFVNVDLDQRFILPGSDNVGQLIVFQPVEQRFVLVSWQQIRHRLVAIEDGDGPAVRAFDDCVGLSFSSEISTDWVA